MRIFVTGATGFIGAHLCRALVGAGHEIVALVRDLGTKNFLMLRNHGLITVGDNIPDAFLLLYLFESACTIQVRAMQAGSELIAIDRRIIATAQSQAQAVTRGLGGALAWPGLLRRLDRLDPTYKD